MRECVNMAEKGPLLTSCIIFYLSIGAAVFQMLEESNWELARSRYVEEKEAILQKYSLTKQDLDHILEVRTSSSPGYLILNTSFNV